MKIWKVLDQTLRKKIQRANRYEMCFISLVIREMQINSSLQVEMYFDTIIVDPWTAPQLGKQHPVQLKIHVWLLTPAKLSCLPEALPVT